MELQSTSLESKLKSTGQQRAALVDFLRGKTPTYATVLLSGVLGLYGVEALQWDTQTIEMELEKDLEVQIPRVVFDQLAGLLAALGSDAVYHDPEVFDQVTNALNRASVQHSQEAPTTEEIAWTATELGLVDPEPTGRPDHTPWSHQVRAYCKVVMREDGFQVAPAILRFAGEPISAEWSEDPDMMAGVHAAHQEMADELDAELDRRIQELLDHLELIGIKLPSA